MADQHNLQDVLDRNARAERRQQVNDAANQGEPVVLAPLPARADAGHLPPVVAPVLDPVPGPMVDNQVVLNVVPLVPVAAVVPIGANNDQAPMHIPGVAHALVPAPVLVPQPVAAADLFALLAPQLAVFFAQLQANVVQALAIPAPQFGQPGFVPAPVAQALPQLAQAVALQANPALVPAVAAQPPAHVDQDTRTIVQLVQLAQNIPLPTSAEGIFDFIDAAKQTLLIHPRYINPDQEGFSVFLRVVLKRFMTDQSNHCAERARVRMATLPDLEQFLNALTFARLERFLLEATYPREARSELIQRMYSQPMSTLATFSSYWRTVRACQALGVMLEADLLRVVISNIVQSQDDGVSLLRREWELNPPATVNACLLYTSPSPRDGLLSRMPSSA